MQPDKEQQQEKTKIPGQNAGAPGEKASVDSAHIEAEKDIEADPELSAHNPNDDLDEAETARLGDGKNELI